MRPGKPIVCISMEMHDYGWIIIILPTFLLLNYPKLGCYAEEALSMKNTFC